jgi:Ser-tRNA(Ala) deacylase AlaX
MRFWVSSSESIVAQSELVHTIEHWKTWLGNAISNWQQPIPLPRKVWMALRNVAIRGVKRQACCGHHGEPGC